MEALKNLAKRVGTHCIAHKMTLSVAESCTGGLISQTLTSIPGSSQWFDCGFITYSNRAKTHQLGVPASLIREHGAVSEAVAKAMAQGGLVNSQANLSLATTGIAGPTGASPQKPVGLVYIALAWQKNCLVSTCHFNGDRDSVREQATQFALQLVLYWGDENHSFFLRSRPRKIEVICSV